MRGVQLGTVCEVIMGQAPKGSSYNTVRQGWPLVAGAGDFDGHLARPSKYTSQPTKLSQSGDVLLGIRASIGARAIADTQVCLGRGVAALRPGPEMDARYLWHWLESVGDELVSKARGATFKQVSRRDVCGLGVRLPALDEQRRISRILDAADALRAKRREASVLSQSFPASMYFAAFEGQEKQLPTDRSVRALGEVADIASGITKGRRSWQSLSREVPYLAVSNVQAGRLDLSTVKTIWVSPDEVERYRLAPNDLLLTEGGDPDKLGRGTIWNGEIDGCLHQNHVFRVRVHSEQLIDPLFLQAQMVTGRVRQYFLRAAKQTTGIASINKTQLKSLPVLVPPVAAQQRFVAGLLRHRATRVLQDEHLAHLDALFVSLQGRAFSGEL